MSFPGRKPFGNICILFVWSQNDGANICARLQSLLVYLLVNSILKIICFEGKYFEANSYFLCFSLTWARARPCLICLDSECRGSTLIYQYLLWTWLKLFDFFRFQEPTLPWRNRTQWTSQFMQFKLTQNTIQTQWSLIPRDSAKRERQIEVRKYQRGIYKWRHTKKGMWVRHLSV